MSRYRMGLTTKELIALDNRGMLKRFNKRDTRIFARKLVALVFRGSFRHPPSVIHRIDTVNEEGGVIDFSHRRPRSQWTRP